MLHPSLQGMVAAIQTKMSRVALHLRFTRSSADFLFASLNTVLKYSVHSAQIMPAVLKNFSRVVIFDSSSWDVKPELKHVFRGSGGSASDANCKLQAGYDYKSGSLGFFEITEGAKPDQGYSCCLSNFVKKDDLLLFDLGYFKLILFQEIIKKMAYFLSRFLVGTTLRDAVTMEQIDIGKTLSRFKGDILDMKVIMGNNQHQVPCRLICLRVTEQVASARRRKRLKEAKRKGRTPSKTHLELCDWTFLVTNASAEILPVETVFPLYRLRWQIELIFKQLKSVLRIHSSNTRNEYRLRCELYGKLIMAVLIHYLHSSLNFEMWSTKKTEVSFDKLYKRIQERMFSFFHDLLTSATAAVDKFIIEIKSLGSACIKTRQRSRKTTLELLEDSYGI